ncbi:ATP-grasp domain-containing protein [Anabaena cylindrica FACHB-243]|uniref:Carbamoyl phosphate synthase-like protein n=1 Tax=Anabaena cylindrica (strain ATCC 27899 / PCC 7122) TaxID=272123 RepID=K9ZCK6_ANACC|nr:MULTISPECIES: ATP-grasp domain-containing protein [Anabaena]AFZ56953.1 carbamoyl phosphate synthase-like protein [Anabaena cylindrica PCC 7122]MBD2418863.1 ATP-grasp domain-containing protein [Anabaena cylindrica FACHB-243]MBY5285767.1 hypothetical protein [Anabaena sp. CCAP 1446/1C]MBY5308754.1 hypothetical protein [Anabaena sp. CCAP 1446/1C]MCM2405143.1 ATP-grasp domain-containing protein [Anabaena sp. CCAP 1446/1C]
MKKNILVTATGGRSVGSGILHALTRNSPDVSERWNVVAADAHPFAWGLYQTNEHTLLPLAKDINYIDSLKTIVNRFKIDAIVPGSEAETTVLSNNTNQFKDCKIVCNRSDLMFYMNDKFLLEKKLKKMGIPYIPTFPLEEYEAALTLFNFPFIVKPTTGTGGSKGLELIATREELNKLIGLINNKSFFCIQPYIGDADNEYTVGILNDKDGNLIDSIVMRRKLIGLSLLTTKQIHDQDYAVSTGYSQGFFVEDKEVSNFCEKIALEFDSRGPLNIQLRKHKGALYIFDFHPRFSGTTPMRADVGFNEVDILLRNHLFGEKFSRLNYRTNVAAIRAFEHVIIPIEKML